MGNLTTHPTPLDGANLNKNAVLLCAFLKTLQGPLVVQRASAMEEEKHTFHQQAVTLSERSREELMHKLVGLVRESAAKAMIALCNDCTWQDIALVVQSYQMDTLAAHTDEVRASTVHCIVLPVLNQVVRSWL
jgi:hypothetical protein